MPVSLKDNLKFAIKQSRDDYVSALQNFLETYNKEQSSTKETIEQSKQKDQDQIEKLKTKLEEAISPITPSNSKDDVIFNNMQLTALLAFEAAFFKKIQDKDYEQYRELYIKLHKELYGAGSQFQNQLKLFEVKVYIKLRKELYREESYFQNQLKLFEVKVEKNYSIEKNLIQGNPAAIEFDAKLDFQKKVNDLLSNVKNSSDNNTESQTIILPKADDQTAIAFLANIDPNIMAYIVVNNHLEIKIEKHKVIDILHEGLIGTKALCCTIIDTGILLAPPAALGAAAFIFGGLSIPLTVGIALFCLSAEIAYHEKKDMDQSFESSRVGMIKNDLRRKVDETLNDQPVDLRPKQLWSPMQLFDVEKLLKSTVNYTISSYKNHKKEFQDKVPTVANSLDDLIKLNYMEQKQDDKLKPCSKTDIERFQKHSKALIGLDVTQNK